MPIQSALIVDDSQMARIVLKKQLEANNISVVMVDNGEEAIEFLLANQSDIVFMDCLMPGMDGFETTRKIKQNPLIANNIIVMSTGKESDEDKNKANIAGASAYMSKSSSPKPLQMILDKFNQQATEKVSEPKPVNSASKADLDALKTICVTHDSLDKVLAERLKRHDFGFLINKIADLSGKISEDIAKDVAENVAHKVSETVSNELTLVALTTFSEEFSNDTEKKLSSVSEQLENKIIFAVKTALGDIHQYIDGEISSIKDLSSPELKDKIKDFVVEETKELKFKIDRLEASHHVEQLIEQKTHETVEKNMSIYAASILEHQLAHEIIEQNVKEKLLEYNNKFSTLEKIDISQIKSSQQLTHKLFNVIAIIFSASAMALSIYTLIKS